MYTMNVNEARLVFSAVKHSWNAQIGVLLLSWLITSCGEKKEIENSAATSSDGLPIPTATPLSVPDRPSVPPLTETAKNTLLNQSLLIRVEGQPDRMGVIIERVSSSSGLPAYQFLCSLPSAPDTVLCAATHKQGTMVATAHKIVELPNGLQVYQFHSEQSFRSYSNSVSPTNSDCYACRLEQAGSLTTEQRAALEEKITVLQEREKELSAKLRNLRPAPPQQQMDYQFEEFHHAQRQILIEQTKLRASIAALMKQLKSDIGTLEVKEVAWGATPEQLQIHASDSESLLFVERSGLIKSLRHNGQWITIDDVIKGNTNEPAKVILSVRGDRNSMSVHCHLKWKLNFGKPECTMLAATTYELESVSGATVDERLTNASPTTYSMNSEGSTWQKQLSWNGEPTTLWIKLFQDGNDDKPILNEAIHVSYMDGLQAQWEKPPSPLIELPEPDPHTPPDLAGEIKSLQLAGTILDLVAAREGSVLLVRSDKPPYWQALDLPSCTLLNTSWRAGPDTLAAAQADKIYLLDRKTGIIETWELEGKTRSGAQILPFDGPIISMAAAVSATAAPLMVVTAQQGYFVDPVNFETLSNGFDISPSLSSVENENFNQPKLKPETVRVRASHDGALFQISGESVRDSDLKVFSVALDPTGAAMEDYAHGPYLALRGRRTSSNFPDHGGTGVELRPQSTANQFPGKGTSINFMTNHPMQKNLGVFRGSPVSPPSRPHATAGLAYDRILYYDSSQKIMVIPEGKTLHVIPIRLPQLPSTPPSFVFPGEMVRFSLPKGSNHKLVSSEASESSITQNEATWTAPTRTNQQQLQLNLEWNGELGSTMKQSYELSIRSKTQGIMVESPDGKTRLPLRRLGIINTSEPILSFAGSGQVMMMKNVDAIDVWSLSDFRKLFSTDKRTQFCRGDADQIYTFDNEGKMKVYDLRTAQVVAERMFDNQEGRRPIYTTGMSSKLPLFAIERDNHQPFLQIINRQTLEPTLLDFSREIQQRFFIPQFSTNASGTASWSLNNLVVLSEKGITVRTFNMHLPGGTPDETGKFVVSSLGWLDASKENAKMLDFKEITGSNTYHFCGVDESGTYFMLADAKDGANQAVISVREFCNPSVERCKLILPSSSEIQGLRLISGTKRLICRLNIQKSCLGVFELDIPSILSGLPNP